MRITLRTLRQVNQESNRLDMARSRRVGGWLLWLLGLSKG